MDSLQDDPGEPPREDAPGADALADRYCRHAYRHLRAADAPVSVASLARAVVARATGKPADAVTLDERKRMYTALDRAHLPDLEYAGLVERDHARDVVALRAMADHTVETAENPPDDSGAAPADAPARAGQGRRIETRTDAPSEPGR